MGSTSGESLRGRGTSVVRRVLLAAALTFWAGPLLAASAAASAPAAATPPGHPASAATKKKAPAAPVKLIDINSASRKELKTLPGVDDALADKIIANRPYLTKADLVTKGVMPDGPYGALRNKIVAGQKSPPKAKTSGKAASAPASGAAAGGKS
jgi:competence protein ComEA